VLLEAKAFSERLANLMVKENVSKIIIPKVSKLFGKKGTWDKFISNDNDLLTAARNACPITTNPLVRLA
jgi:hypothetical protein